MELSEVFNEVEEVESTPEQAEPEKEVEQVEETTETETVENTENGETTAPHTEDEPKTVPIKALMSEREKRQSLERQLADFQAKQEQKPAPDVFEDQKAYTEHMTQQMQTALFNERANLSEFHARREFSDLDDKMETYKTLAQQNPSLHQQVMNAPSPYHEMYDIVKKHETLEEMQNIDDFKAKTRAEIEAQVRAEIEAEVKAKIEKDETLRKSIKPSLVGQTSKGTLSKAPDSGPITLSQIFND